MRMMWIYCEVLSAMALILAQLGFIRNLKLLHDKRFILSIFFNSITV